MGNFQQIGTIGELKDGTMKAVPIGGHDILVAKVGNRYYASDNHCPHRGGKLSQGKLEQSIVTCPLHGSQFDLKDGQVVRWLKGTGITSAIGKALKSPRNLTTYNLKVEHNAIWIEI